MSRSCFVPRTGNIKRVPVMNGEHWVEIKERLTYYESEKLDNAAVIAEFADGQADFSLNLPNLSILRMETWLVAWSFTDENGQVAPVTRDYIEALDKALGAELEEIIRAQGEMVDAETDEAAADTAIERHRKIIASLEARKNALRPSDSDGLPK